MFNSMVISKDEWDKIPVCIKYCAIGHLMHIIMVYCEDSERVTLFKDVLRGKGKTK